MRSSPRRSWTDCATKRTHWLFNAHLYETRIHRHLPTARSPIRYRKFPGPSLAFASCATSRRVEPSTVSPFGEMARPCVLELQGLPIALVLGVVKALGLIAGIMWLGRHP